MPMMSPMLKKSCPAWLLIVVGSVVVWGGSAHASPWRVGSRFTPQAQQLFATPTTPSYFARTFWPSDTPSFTRSYTPDFSRRVSATAFTPNTAAATVAPAAFVDSPYFQYLLWRRSLNPARFDYYHPRLGPLLESITQLPQEVFPPLIPPVTPPVTPPPITPTIPVIPVTPQVPEPSTLLIGLMLGAGGLWARHVRGKAKRA